ncbi:hypothetical protein ACFQDN_23715 [Pseudomonas asuensis]|uniref:hypothetical protein n=1 Tax=Pseudomonas asuensis TaxID=1825787 RepID=UPI00166A8EBD|nr:hypothetical protein [Pseudomonas asuensis]
MSPSITSTEKGQTFSANRIPLIDENRHLAPLVNVSFAANCPAELREIAPYVLRAFSAIAKPGFNTIHIKPLTDVAEENDGTTTDGTTEPHVAQRAVTIEIAGYAEPELSHDQKLARYALDLTHEVFLHGGYYFEMFEKHARGSKERYKTEDEQHLPIVYPPNTHNPYLNDVRHVLQYLPNRKALRVEFLKAYTDDVYSHMVNDLPEGAQKPVQQWLEHLENMAEDPCNPIWAALAISQPRTNISQVLLNDFDNQQLSKLR